MNPKTVLITGAASGIGRQTAILFAQNGWNVVATMRNPAARAVDFDGQTVDAVHLDVLDTASIRSALQQAVGRYGQLDVLVNNAGYGVFSPFETSTAEQARKQFDTNVLGLLDVCREAIPLFREQRHGVIVNIASVAGRIGLPFFSLYNATKWAVEGFSEALQYELKPLGIQVKLVEPGAIKTEFYDRLAEAETGAYQPAYPKARAALMRFGKNGADPKLIAAVVYRAALDRSNTLRYAGGVDAHFTLALRKLLPDRLFFWLIRRFSG